MALAELGRRERLGEWAHVRVVARLQQHQRSLRSPGLGKVAVAVLEGRVNPACRREDRGELGVRHDFERHFAAPAEAEPGQTSRTGIAAEGQDGLHEVRSRPVPGTIFSNKAPDAGRREFAQLAGTLPAEEIRDDDELRASASEHVGILPHVEVGKAKDVAADNEGSGAAASHVQV